jgi:hypothetical protein
MILTDVDRLLDSSAEVRGDTPVARVRALRDELARAAVSLSYARHVLSVDVGLLGRVDGGDADLDGLVDQLPRVLAEASIGGGWSLSSDDLGTMAAADRAVLGEADGLLGPHAALATTDLQDPAAVAEAARTLRAQLDEVTRRREQVEQRLRTVQATIVDRYRSGAASVDDWLD